MDLQVLFLFSVAVFMKTLENVIGIRDTGFGSFDLFEMHSNSYELSIDSSPVTEELLTKREDTQTEPMVRVWSKTGQEFACFLPSGISNDRDMEILNDENFIDISMLLSQLRRNCILSNQGWWSYKYCHGSNITQFHIEGGQMVGDLISLGVFESETEWNEEKLQKSMERQRKNKLIKEHNVAKLSSHNARYVNGTACDVRDVRRTTIAKITCSPYHADTSIVNIIEHETCNYTFVIHAPQLCDHPLFRIDDIESTDVIRCSPILSDEQYRRHTSRKAKSAMSGVQDALKKNLVKERKTKEKEVPLMDIFQLLANSIADKVTSNGRNTIDSEDEEGLNKETEEIIDNLVSETLSSVFGRGDSDAEKDSSSDNSWKGSDAESKSSASRTSNKQRELTVGGKGEKEERSLKRAQEDDDESPENRKHKSKPNIEQATNQGEDGKKSKKEKFKVYHIKLTDQSALQEEDLDKIVEDVAKSDPRLNDGDRSKKIIEVDLSSKKGASSLLAQAIEQYIGKDDSNDVSERQMKQQELEENYSNTWDSIDEEKDDER
ncbi:PREDICTED: protein OS-9-like isoform X2 [Amphimedon queenslandica]|uniref:MRH domain-containing protein n=1 Tax=Amphimedon queenslandica TaxID=400682 RepID=A0AAN0J147_AMPQE|nr:PREDICTED: protein OS-9-like isoform X2 [Amphimedon queenslandica]|eukprot:XP_019850715.1 PREDICTED: protein OS-9-like isoform X2 [Amphimedon queenslandica]